LLTPGAEATVERVERRPESAAASRAPLDAVSRAWIEELALPPGPRDEAVARLHAYLLRIARFELARRRSALAGAMREGLDDLAMQAADDALVAVLAKLETFRGASRFTTWAYKFVLLEAGVKARRRAWQDRELPLPEEGWATFADRAPSAQRSVEDAELLEAIRAALESDLTDHQREVFTALALNEVPIDVLAQRKGTTRGALYKTLHDARRRLRSALAVAGHALGDEQTGGEQ
jgi:RNA polymerase sigma-70 factor, ECF subfamily